jgi:DNA-binding FadR family transcriptional regulator
VPPTTVHSDGFRVPKTAEVVAGNLRSQIIRGVLQEGHSLPSESSLTLQFGISRPTLREAFRILESERLIEVRRGARGGALVKTPDSQVAATYAGLYLQAQGVRLQDVYDARQVIERPAVAVLAASPRAAAIDRLRSNLWSANALVDEHGAEAEGLAELSGDFHSIIVEAAGNQTLALFETMLRRIVDGAGRSFVESQSNPSLRLKSHRATIRAHTKLVDLIEAGEVHAADDFWRRHLEEMHRRLGEGGSAGATVLDLLG